MAPLTTTDTDTLATAPFQAEIAREQLQRGLAAVGTVIPAKPIYPTLGEVLLSAEADGLRLTGTDLDLRVSVTVPADGLVPSTRISLPAKKLSELARELSPAPVHLRQSSGGQRVTLRNGRAEFKLSANNGSEFPEAPNLPGATTWLVRAGVLHDMTGQVAFATSTEESRPILNGVLWQLRPTQMIAVATNGHRLAKLVVPVAATTVDGTPSSESRDLIVPPKAFEVARKLFDAGETLRLTVGPNHLSIESDTARLTTRLIEGPYPNYEQVIPKAHTRTLVVARDGLIASLRRVMVVAGDDAKRTVFDVTEREVMLSVQSPDLGEAHDPIEATYEGEAPFRIAFNAGYLLEILRHIPTPLVRVSCTAPERAALIEPIVSPAEARAEAGERAADLPLAVQGGAALTMLCMPLRIID